MAFELFTDDNTDEFPSNPEADLRVRWLFRNSTAGDLKSFPLFGSGQESSSWSKFVTEIKKRAITDVGDWCSKCGSDEDFCAAYEDDDESVRDNDEDKDDKGGMSNVVAGVIGAMVTLGVVALVGAAAFVLMRRRKTTRRVDEKGSVRSGSTDGNAAKV